LVHFLCVIHTCALFLSLWHFYHTAHAKKWVGAPTITPPLSLSRLHPLPSIPAELPKSKLSRTSYIYRLLCLHLYIYLSPSPSLSASRSLSTCLFPLPLFPCVSLSLERFLPHSFFFPG
ncbi:unnamed protein product, partial [Laminaria digitata]